MVRVRMFAVLWFIMNVVVSCGAVAVYLRARPPKPVEISLPAEVAPTAIIHSAPEIECVQKLADLVSLRVHVSDILSVDQPGWLNGYKIIWIIRGDAECVTDLTCPNAGNRWASR